MRWIYHSKISYQRFVTLLLFRQALQVNDSVAPADDDAHRVDSQIGIVAWNDVAEADAIKSRTEVNDPNAVVDEIKMETGDIVVHRLNVDSQTVEESTLDEGWQEAYSKGRSGNGAGRKFRQRQPDLMKKRMSLNKHFNRRQDVQQQNISSLQKTSKRPSLSKSSSQRAMKNAEIDVSTNTTKPQLMASGSAAVTSTTLASKSLSYKEVALAPPGTVLRPMLEKLELNLERTETQIYRTSSASTGEESKSDTVMLDLPIEGTELPCEKQESQESAESVENLTSESEGDLGSYCGQKASDISQTKLSAAAEPYNPGGFLFIDLQSSAATTGNYPIMVADPISWAGVSCGIHSPPYYSANHSNGVGMPRSMNPDAPEFVPMRSVQNSSQHAGGDASVSVDSSSFLKAEKDAVALKKRELASFIVKSSQKEVPAARKTSPKAESGDTSAKHSALTEIVYSREEESGANANETNGGEGFVIVAKKRRRKNKLRLTNVGAGLYHQPSSVCA